MISRYVRTSSYFRLTVLAFAVYCILSLSTAQATDDFTKQLRVSPDGHFLMQPDGQPFFWLGENGWELFQWPNREEVDIYLSDRAHKGFNIIQAVLGGVDGGVNRYGDEMFIDHDPTRPNQKYFQNVDWVVDRAEHFGIRIAIVAVWEPGNQTTGPGYGKGTKIFNPENAEIYGRWIGERYRNKGIVWILGGDSNPLWPDAGFAGPEPIIDFRPVYDALAKGINEGNGAPAFITYHPSCCSFPGTAQPRTSLYLGHKSWLTMNMLQSSHYTHPAPTVQTDAGWDFGWLGPFNYEPIYAEYSSTPTRPIVDGEARFEGLTIDNDPPHKQEKGVWSGYEARNAAYHAVFAGAAGHTYGNHCVWQFCDPAHHHELEVGSLNIPWQEALAKPVSGQLHHLKDLMLSRPYFTRIPDQSILVGDSGAGTRHLGAIRDQNRSYAMIYVPAGQQVTVDLSKLSGRGIVGWWFDPNSGSATRIDGTFKPTGTQTFTPPTSGAQDDWVLVLDDDGKEFGVPGKYRFK